MPVREIAAKIVAFGVVVIACVVGGILALVGPHAYNDYFNTFLGVSLIALGVLAAVVGTLLIVAIVAEARMRQREQQLHITARTGPLGPPPPWGMGDIGRVDGIVQVSDRPSGGGSVRVMRSVAVNWDAPVVIVGLFIWTAVMTIWLVPR